MCYFFFVFHLKPVESWSILDLNYTSTCQPRELRIKSQAYTTFTIQSGKRVSISRVLAGPFETKIETIFFLNYQHSCQ